MRFAYLVLSRDLPRMHRPGFVLEKPAELRGKRLQAPWRQAAFREKPVSSNFVVLYFGDKKMGFRS